MTPTFNQEVLLSFWPIIVLLLGAEIALAIHKLIKKRWTKRMATFYMIYKIVSVITFIFILTRSNLITVDFLAVISELFNTMPAIVKDFMIWGGILLLVIFAINTIYHHFRKADKNNKSHAQKIDKIS